MTAHTSIRHRCSVWIGVGLAMTTFAVVWGAGSQWTSDGQPYGDATGTKPPTEPGQSRSLADQGRSSAALYGRTCARCHALDGKGTEFRVQHSSSIPDFTSRSWHEARSDARLMASIRDGRGTRMPAFEGDLSEQQVRAVVTYLRSFASTPIGTSAKTASDFEMRFRELQELMQDLQRQVDELSRPTRLRKTSPRQ
jgi:mono/diheme cytochrome c family protein